ncbi:MAG TPA: hypothetical protein VLA13_08100, partial [Massilibacterium sp.]|nr:hypothetical protein [Massilibacterium sp.]
QIWEESGHWDEKRFNTEFSTKTWTMDRKRVNEGYHKDNIRIVPAVLNVQVWHDEQKWQVDFRWREMWSKRNNKPVDECPF